MRDGRVVDLVVFNVLKDLFALVSVACIQLQYTEAVQRGGGRHTLPGVHVEVDSGGKEQSVEHGVDW